MIFVSHNSQLEHPFQLLQLRDQVHMHFTMPTSQHGHGVGPSSMPLNLKQFPFFSFGRDAYRTPLQCAYKGPFKVFQPGYKTFTIDLEGWKEIISVDRLKLAFVDLEHPVELSEPRYHEWPLKKDKLTSNIDQHHHPVQIRSSS